MLSEKVMGLAYLVAVIGGAILLALLVFELGFGGFGLLETLQDWSNPNPWVPGTRRVDPEDIMRISKDDWEIVEAYGNKVKYEKLEHYGGVYRSGRESITISYEIEESKAGAGRVLVHEATHAMVDDLRGGQGMLLVQRGDYWLVEIPAMNRQCLFEFKAGDYEDYYGMVEKCYPPEFAREHYKGGISGGHVSEQERDYSQSSGIHVEKKNRHGINVVKENRVYYRDDEEHLVEVQRAGEEILRVQPNLFYSEYELATIDCSYPKDQVERFDFKITNSGSKKIHCAIIETRVDNHLYPLDCGYLLPQQAHETGKNFHLLSFQDIKVGLIGSSQPYFELPETEWDERECNNREELDAKIARNRLQWGNDLKFVKLKAGGKDIAIAFDPATDSYVADVSKIEQCYDLSREDLNEENYYCLFARKAPQTLKQVDIDEKYIYLRFSPKIDRNIKPIIQLDTANSVLILNKEDCSFEKVIFLKEITYPYSSINAVKNFKVDESNLYYYDTKDKTLVVKDKETNTKKGEISYATNPPQTTNCSSFQEFQDYDFDKDYLYAFAGCSYPAKHYINKYDKTSLKFIKAIDIKEHLPEETRYGLGSKIETRSLGRDDSYLYVRKLQTSGFNARVPEKVLLINRKTFTVDSVVEGAGEIESLVAEINSQSKYKELENYRILLGLAG